MRTGQYLKITKDTKLIKLKCGCVVDFVKGRWKERLFRSVCFKHSKR